MSISYQDIKSQLDFAVLDNECLETGKPAKDIRLEFILKQIVEMKSIIEQLQKQGENNNCGCNSARQSTIRSMDRTIGVAGADPAIRTTNTHETLKTD